MSSNINAGPGSGLESIVKCIWDPVLENRVCNLVTMFLKPISNWPPPGGRVVPGIFTTPGAHGSPRITAGGRHWVINPKIFLWD